MTSLISSALAVTLVLVTVGPTAFAQQARGDWTAVQSLPADADISIQLKTGKKVRGDFLSAVVALPKHFPHFVADKWP